MKEFIHKPRRLNHSTKFVNGPHPINERAVSDFWQWGFSDLLQNTTRGILAEYIVAVLLNADEPPRHPWRII